MNTFGQDLRYGARMLVKNPGFTLIAVLTLALGIGANTAVFSVVNALLLRSLPFPAADKLVYVWSSNAQASERSSLSPHNFTDIRARSQSFDGHFAFQYRSHALTGAGQPESLSGIAASGDFGRVMGVVPAQGRWFTADEDQPGRNRVVVISHELWQRRFAGRPLLNETIQLNGEAHTVIGIAAPEFSFPRPNNELWLPLALDLSKFERGTSFLQSVARLKPGVSQAQAQAELLNVTQQIARENNLRDFGANVIALREELLGDIEKPLWILFGAVVLVLLIACLNVANLQLGRATARWKEIAVRAALGASRWQLMKLMLIESVLLGLIGGGLGLLLAAFGIDWLVKLNQEGLLNPKNIGIDRTVILFTLGLSVLTGLIFGLLPAWQMSKTNLNQALRDTGRSASGSGRIKLIRNGLVVVELAMSLVLLVSAGLLLKSFWKLMEVNPGFRSENVATSNITLPRARYNDEWQQAEFFRRTVESARALPGVEAAAVVTNLPFNNSRGATSFEIDGRPTPPDHDGPQADDHTVSPGYFAALGIPLQAGRDFSDADDRQRPGVVIINERLAQLYWPGENPIGKRLSIGSPQEVKLYGKAVSREIVGVIANVKLLELRDEFNPELYVPLAQMPASNMALVVRGKVAAETLFNGMRQVVTALDPNQPIRRTQTLQGLVDRSVAPQRFIAILLVVFAGVAIVLALVGIYGVMSFSVSQRTQEIGIRMALGAQPLGVLWLVIGQGMKLVLLGVVTGLAGAFLLTKVLATLLYGVAATDAATFGGVALLLTVSALLACFFPARRATKVDPLIALRYE
jgi:putative ABC transport system permease protein